MPIPAPLRIWLLLAGLMLCSGLCSAVWGQAIRIQGKTCVPDQECKADSLLITDSVQVAGASRVWNFGDGSAAVTVQNDSAVRHVYQQAGTYTITLTRTLSGSSVTASRNVSIYNRPQPFPQWRSDTTICKGEKITLDPYSGGAPPSGSLTYLWYPKGDTTQTIQVDSSGCYSVEVKDVNGCTYQDRINVDVCGEQKQSQGVKWYFGKNAGLDFGGGGTPNPLTDGKLNTIEGSSSIANTKGELLFYSDGIIIFDKDGNPMKSVVPGDTAQQQRPLDGNKRSTQSALIVPKPTCRGCEYLYYVYTTAEIRGTKTLTYSVVDMRQNSGKGAIVEKNIALNQNGTEQSASVRNDRDSTFWVITRIYGTNTFQIRHLTTAENPNLTTYSGGQAIDSIAKAEGYMKIGPADTSAANAGNRPLAVVIPGPPTNSIDLFTFNDSTGQMSFKRTIQLGPAPPKAYGVEFSPDGNSLYVSMLADTAANGSQNGYSYFVKYDLTQPDSLVRNSKVVLDSSQTKQFGSVQIGPDGRIYVAVQGSSTLGVVENPNAGLLDTLKYNPSGQSLGGATSQLGLPNLVANFNDNSSGPGFTYADTCARQPTIFQGSPNCPKLKETYTWNFGDGSMPVSTTALKPQLHTYTQPGSYSVSFHILTKTSTGAVCKDTTITQRITILETPENVNLGGDTAICNRKGLTLDLKVKASLYVWVVNGALAGRQQTLTLKRPGYYVVVGIAANGECYKSDTLEVQIKPPPSLDLGPDTLFCYGASVKIEVPQQTWNTFLWSDGSTNRSINISKAGSYSVTARNPDGCENSDTIQVSQLPRLRVSAAMTPPTSCTSADGIIALTPSPSAQIYTYAWTRLDGANLPPVARQTQLIESTYKVRITDSVHTCTLDTAFTLKSAANRLALTPNIKNAVCTRPASGTVSLSVQGGTPVAYTWLDSLLSVRANTPTLADASPGLYHVQVQDANGCKAMLDSIRVRLDSTGFARLAVPPAKCPGIPASLSLADGDAPGNVYRWSTGATTPIVVVSEPGTYSLSVQNTLTGCKAVAQATLTDKPAPTVSLSPTASLCVGDQGKAQLIASGAPNLLYRWLPGQETEPTITVSEVGKYTLYVTDPNGCTATAATTVIDQCEPRLSAPDAFSPNKDGLNDVFQVFGAYLAAYEMRIYNRWGELIFVSHNLDQPWDGTYRGQDCQPQLYPYVVTYKSQYFPERAPVVIRGSVMLLR